MTLARAPLGLAGGEREIAQSRRNGVGECLALQSRAFRVSDEQDGFSCIKGGTRRPSAAPPPGCSRGRPAVTRSVA